MNVIERLPTVNAQTFPGAGEYLYIIVDILALCRKGFYFTEWISRRT